MTIFQGAVLMILEKEDDLAPLMKIMNKQYFLKVISLKVELKNKNSTDLMSDR